MSTSPSTNTGTSPSTAPSCSVFTCDAPATHRHYLHSDVGGTRILGTCMDHRADLRGAAARFGLSVTRTVRLQVISDAAHLIRTQGWHQGGFYPGWVDTLDAPHRLEAADEINRNGYPACIVGALAACGAEQPELLEVAAAVLGTSVVCVTPEGVLADWQDQPERTCDDVLAVLDRAAVAAVIA